MIVATQLNVIHRCIAKDIIVKDNQYIFVSKRTWIFYHIKEMANHQRKLQRSTKGEKAKKYRLQCLLDGVNIISSQKFGLLNSANLGTISHFKLTQYCIPERCYLYCTQQSYKTMHLSVQITKACITRESLCKIVIRYSTYSNQVFWVE